MYLKVLNSSMNQYGFQYKEGLNEDTREFNLKENSFGLHFANERSIMGFLDYGDDLIAEVDVPIGEPIVMFESENGRGTKYKAKRIILTNIRPLWTLKTFRYLVEECGVDMDYEDWLINVAEMDGHHDIAEYLRQIKK